MLNRYTHKEIGEAMKQFNDLPMTEKDRAEWDSFIDELEIVMNINRDRLLEKILTRDNSFILFGDLSR